MLYRTRLVFRVGSCCLPVLHASFPRDATLVSACASRRWRRGLSPSAAPRSRGLPHRRLRSRWPSSNTTLPLPFLGGASVCPVRFSLAVTHRIPVWFLFLRVLRRFTSPGCCSSRSLSRSRIRRSLVQRLHAPRQSLSQLVTSFFIYRAKLSAL